MESMVERGGVLQKRTDVIDNVNTFPKIDKMTFRMQSVTNGSDIPKFNTNNVMYSDNEESKGSVNAFDADYLN